MKPLNQIIFLLEIKTNNLTIGQLKKKSKFGE